MELNHDRLVAAYQALKTIVQDSEPILSGSLQPPQIFSQLDSTNRQLWELWKRADLPEGTAILAEQQRAGKGQWGREWRSSPGGLYLSIAFQPDLPVHNAAQLTLCSSWGIAKVLRNCPVENCPVENCPDDYGSAAENRTVQPLPVQIPVQVKWLNDLILEGRKLGGILTETRVRGDRISQAIVGIGINWSNPVPDPGICLQPFLATHPHPWLDSLEKLAALVHWGAIVGYHQWQRVGMATMLPQYLDLLIHLGEIILWEGQLGQIVGVTEQGNLRVRLQSEATGQPPPEGASIGAQEISLPPGSLQLGYPGQSILDR
jgi:BirA family transcriptional regulator, biotin operon repressor / biotin---[acetyl-CoA-carboxylase] ligase